MAQREFLLKKLLIRLFEIHGPQQRRNLHERMQKIRSASRRIHQTHIAPQIKK